MLEIDSLARTILILYVILLALDFEIDIKQYFLKVTKRQGSSQMFEKRTDQIISWLVCYILFQAYFMSEPKYTDFDLCLPFLDPDNKNLTVEDLNSE